MKAWAGVAEAYRRSFAQACAGAIEPLLAVTDATDARGAARVHDRIGPLRHLDVGCGDGRLAAAASETGRAVVACDVDAPMCELTRSSAPGVVVVTASLPTLPWPSHAFDVVTANFVINHVDDPRACVREMARVCRPGGVVAATIWPAGGGGFGAALRPAFSVQGVAPLPDQSLPAERDFERSVGGMHGLFRDAGLTAVTATELYWVWAISPADLWAGITAGVATPGMTYLAQSRDVQARMKAVFFETAAVMCTNGSLTFDARAVLATGRAS